MSRPPWWGPQEQNLGSSQECHHDALICTAQSGGACQRGLGAPLGQGVQLGAPACLTPHQVPAAGRRLLWAPPQTAGKSGYLQLLLISSWGWGRAP